jgi:hopanoid biosynthesis associated RND transporter like protein HpnN
MSVVNPQVGWLAAWVDTVSRHAVATLLCALALTLACAWYVGSTLGIDTGTENMIDEEVPFRQNDITFGRLFPQLSDQLVVVIDAPTPEDASAAAGSLAAVLSGPEQPFRDIYRPGSEEVFARAGLLYLDLEALYALSDRIVAAQPLLAQLAEQPDLAGLAAVLEQAASNPAMAAEGGSAEALADLLNRMAAVAEAQAEGRPLALSWQALVTGGLGQFAQARRFLLLRPDLEEGALQPAADAIRRLRGAAAELGLTEERGFRVRLTGPVALDHQELQAVQLGGSTAGILSLVLVALLLALGLRSGRLVFATIATLLVGLVWTAAFAALSVGRLNLISVAFAVLFIGLAVDFGIHACLRYREERRKGAGRPLVQAFSAVGGGIALSAICAAAGFFAFLPTDYLGLAELGLIAGAGMLIALLATFTVLPAILALLPLRRVAAPKADGRPEGGGGPPRMAPRTTLAVALILSLGALFAAPAVVFDFDPINLKDPNFESVETFFELARDPQSTPYRIDVVVEGEAAAQEMSEALHALPEVGTVMRLRDYVPRGQADKLVALDDLAFVVQPLLMAEVSRGAPDPAALAGAFDRLRALSARLAEAEGPLGAAAGRLERALDRLAEAQEAPAVELDDRLMRHFPDALERLQLALSPTRPIALEDLPEQLRARWQSGEMLRLEVQPATAIRDNEELRRFASAVLSVAPQATGAPTIISGAADAILQAFVTATALAFGAVLVILAITLRRPLEILLITLTLMLAALWTAGAAALLGIPFNFANIIALPLLFGLGVASAIHFVLRLREEGSGAAVLRSSTSSGVLFSALTTIAAFGSLAVSGHLGMASMGQLLTLAITVTLVATLIVLPAMIEVLQRRRTGEARTGKAGKARTGKGGGGA